MRGQPEKSPPRSRPNGDGGLALRWEEATRVAARELHDSVVQQLAILSIEVSKAGNRTGASVETLEGLLGRIAGISGEVLRIAHDLHPSLLDDIGLAPALEELCRVVQREHGTRITFSAAELPVEITGNVGACLYQVAQESLANAMRHAKADSVAVTLGLKEGGLRLTVIDSGLGFASAQVTSGRGIQAMRERVELAKGNFRITSVRGEGTRVEATVPSAA